jgi:hypothetical protein
MVKSQQSANKNKSSAASKAKSDRAAAKKAAKDAEMEQMWAPAEQDEEEEGGGAQPEPQVGGDDEDEEFTGDPFEMVEEFDGDSQQFGRRLFGGLDKSSKVELANSTNRKGVTLLHTAVECEVEALIPVLLANGADVNQRDKRGAAHVPAHYPKPRAAAHALLPRPRCPCMMCASSSIARQDGATSRPGARQRGSSQRAACGRRPRRQVLRQGWHEPAHQLALLADVGRVEAAVGAGGRPIARGPAEDRPAARAVRCLRGRQLQCRGRRGGPHRSERCAPINTLQALRSDGGRVGWGWWRQQSGQLLSCAGARVGPRERVGGGAGPTPWSPLCAPSLCVHEKN